MLNTPPCLTHGKPYSCVSVAETKAATVARPQNSLQNIYIYPQNVYINNKIALMFYSQSSIGLEYTDPAYDSISSSLFTTRRRSFQAATAVMRANVRSIFFTLLLRILHTFYSPCKPIVLLFSIHSFILLFLRFPLFPRISFSLPLTHSFVRSRTLNCVRAEQFVYIVDNRLFFSSPVARFIPPTSFFFYMTSIYVYKCKYNILHQELRVVINKQTCKLTATQKNGNIFKKLQYEFVSSFRFFFVVSSFFLPACLLARLG